jgi:hypothetical protein
MEFIQIIKAHSRPGDIVGEFFCSGEVNQGGALKKCEHMMVSDVDKRWWTRWQRTSFRA